MVKSRLVNICPGEADLIEAMKRVEYGELYGVEIDLSGDRFLELEVSVATHDLLLYIQSGVQYIDVLTVHHGQPTQAETNTIIHGFRCRKKIKFPTIPTEG